MTIYNPIVSNIQLLVEGNDQRNFFGAFLRHISREDIQIQNFRGVNDLQGFLSAFATTEEFSESVTSLSIVRDAEGSAQSAFQSVQSSLANVRLPVPDRPREPIENYLSVNVLILPDENRPGMLETLLCETFADFAMNDCIDTFLDCAGALQGTDIRRPDKSRAHAYISTRPEPQPSVGVAAQKGYWDLDHPSLADIRSFLEAL